MPYKFNESRRHKFPQARYRVTNWPEYDAALVRRGDLTLWFTEEAIAAWRRPPASAQWLLSTKYLAADATLTVQVDDRLLGLGGPWGGGGGGGGGGGWLRCDLDASGLGLSPGDLVLAGTSLGLYPENAGDHVVVSIDGVSVTECFVI